MLWSCHWIKKTLWDSFSKCGPGGPSDATFSKCFKISLIRLKRIKSVSTLEINHSYTPEDAKTCSALEDQVQESGPYLSELEERQDLNISVPMAKSDDNRKCSRHFLALSLQPNPTFPPLCQVLTLWRNLFHSPRIFNPQLNFSYNAPTSFFFLLSFENNLSGKFCYLVGQSGAPIPFYLFFKKKETLFATVL